MEIAIAGFLIALLLAANAVATRVVLRDEHSQRGQKLAQILFVWLVPIAGAIVVFAVHRRPDPPSLQYYKPADPGAELGLFGKPGRPVSRLHDDD